MGLFVYIEQILWIDVSVALRGGKTGVTQEFLDRPEVATPLQEVRGEGVAEGVCTGLRSDRSPDQTPGDDSSHGSVRKSLAASA